MDDDDDELDRLLEEFGLQPSRLARDVPGDEAPPRLSDLEDLGDYQ